MMNLQNKIFGEKPSPRDFEQLPMRAADFLRGAVRPELNLLSLLFLKRLSDVYSEEYDELLKKCGDEETNRTTGM
jgi:hypothetical protein